MAAVPPPQVTYGQVPFDDNLGKYVQDPTGAIYTDYQIINRYEKSQHRYMLGVTSTGGFAGGTAAFVQLANPTLLWISDWTASRVGVPPEIPDPFLSAIQSGWVLLDEMVEPVSVVLISDGVNPIYRISGTYVYGKLNPSTILLNDIAYGRPPWITDNLLFGRKMSPGFLTQNLNTTAGQNK